MVFNPDYLRVDAGSFIEWTLWPESKNSAYQSKCHVISFDKIPVESDCLKMEEGC